MVRLPKKLEKDTIVDAIFEIRFSSNAPAVSSILLGLLYQRFQSEYKGVTNLGPSQMPVEFVEKDENLRFAHHHRLDGDIYSLNIGNHVVSIGCTKPYTGWPNFKPKITELLKFLESTSLIHTPERFSIKYVNVIPAGKDPTLSGIKLDVKAGAFDVATRPITLRVEIVKDDFVNIVQVVTGISATSKNYQIDGILLDIDTIYMGSWGNFWADVHGLLEKAHNVEKEIFFGLLEDNMVASLNPQY